MDAQPIDQGAILKSGYDSIPDYLNTQIAQSLGRAQIGQANAQTQQMQAKTAQSLVETEQQRQYGVDVQAALQSGDPMAVVRLAAKYPGQKDALKASYDAMDNLEQRSQLRQAAGIWSALNAGDTKTAIAQLETRVKADNDAGRPAQEDQERLDRLKSGDMKAINSVKGELGLFMASVVPDKFASVVDQLGSGNRAPKVVGYGDALVNEDGTPVYQAKDAPFTLNGGDTRFGPSGGTAPSGATPSGAAPGGPLTVDTVIPVIKSQESHGNYTAKNKETGALGAYQVMPATGQSLAQRVGLPWKPELMTSNSKAGVTYQDQIGRAAVQEAIDNSGGDAATMASYYHGGSDRSGWGPRTQKYASEVVSQLGGGSPVATSGPQPIASVPKPADPGYRMLTPEENTAQGLDPNVRYQISPKGEITALGGQSKAQLKPIPPSVGKEIITNRSTLRQIDSAIAALKAHPAAVGWGTGSLGDWYTNNVGDPKGVAARAAIAKIGGQIIHDVSGAAVTLSEEPRFRPYVPTITDNPQVAQQKLTQLRNLAQGVLDDYASQYSEDQGYRPFGGKSAQSDSGPVKVRSIQQANALKPGTLYMTPDGRTMRR